MKVIYNITKNKFNTSLNQETTEIKVSFKTGYYPLTGGVGGDLSNYYTKDETYSKTEVDDIISYITVVDTSNLVPYNGATKDVNIASNYFKTSKGFDFTFDENNYFRTYNNGSFNNFVFRSKDNGEDNFGGIFFSVDQEEGFNIQKINGNGITNIFRINENETYSIKPFVSEEGFKTPTGTANQALTANGDVFDLDTKADLVGGKIPSSQLPSYVDDVLEFSNLASFPATGESGKIYIAIDTNVTYRWSGTGYSEISASLALGETSSTAYRGDRGKIAYDHSQVTHDKNLVGLGNVDNTSDLDKPISTATQNALVDGLLTKLNKGSYTGTAQDLNEKIDNIQIGGRNLFGFNKGINFVINTIDKSINGYICNYASSELLGRIMNLGLEGIGGDFTVSLYIKSDKNVDVNVNLCDISTSNSNVSLTTDFVKHIFYFKNVYQHIASPFFGFLDIECSDISAKVFVKDLKIEIGNKATDWTPAPEDKQDRLQDVTGNIGVGKTDVSATEKLDVNGNVKAIGFKTPSGTANQALTANGGVFDLTSKADLVGGKIPASQLPSYVDDVLEFANLASFPAIGESGKIYIAIDTNLTYRWGGSSYVVMSSSLALGETSSTAYRGDRGKIAYDHSQTTGNPHGTTKADIGLGNVQNIDATNPTNIVQTSSYRFVTDSEKANLTTAYNHSQVTGNPHGTKVEELSDVSGTDTTIVDTDVILKKDTAGLWKKITFANFKNWFTTELTKKINIGLDTVFNFKNISAMTLTDFRSINPDIETIYFTAEQNATGWQQIIYNGLGITIPATTETLVSLTNENFIELDSDSTFNLINVENTKINGIFEEDFIIIKFNAGVVTPATANQWFKVILKINNVQTAVSPVFYLTETSGTVEQIAHNFALNVPAEMVTNGATLHLKTSSSMTFNNPTITVARVHKSTSANL